MNDEREYDSIAHRHRQIKRVLTLMTLLCPLRYGSQLRDLHTGMREQYGELSARTVYRDLKAMEELNLVNVERDRGSTRWTWKQNQIAETLATVSKPAIARMLTPT